MSSGDSRRTSIADAALVVLAREGARGLTHRAIDAQLELPSGSTSYYFRTRSALLLGAAERLLALDEADLEGISESASGITSLLQRWLAPRSRERSLARMELLLAAARDSEFEFMLRARAGFIERVARAQRNVRAEESRAIAVGLVALVDGLTLHGLVCGPLSARALRQLFERFRASGATDES